MRTLNVILNGMSKIEFLTRSAISFRFWFENVFGYEWEEMYEEWLSMIEQNNRVAIMAFTGSGKTEVMGIAYPLWLAWFNEGTKMLIVSNSLDQSTTILARIKAHIDYNELLQELKPQNKPENQWCSKTEMELSTRANIACKPYSENLRSYHVDYVLSDEIATYANHDIFLNVLVPRTLARRGKVAGISTPLHLADLMMRLLSNKQFKGGIFPAINKDGKPTTKRFDLKYLKEIRETIGEPAFEREYLCNPRAEAENAVFPPKVIYNCYRFTETFKGSTTEGAISFIGIDLAISSGPRADFDCYTVVEKFGEHCSLIHGERHKGFSVKAKVERIKALYYQYLPITILIDESNVGHSVIEELRLEGLPVEAVSFHSKGRSLLIANLRKLMDNKKLVIPKLQDETMGFTFTEKLTEELLGFTEVKSPSGNLQYLSKAAHDDTVMSLALACKGASSMFECIDYIAM